VGESDQDDLQRRLDAALKRIDELETDIERLAVSERRYRTFVAKTGDAFFLHGADGVIIDVNPYACDNLGYSYEELTTQGMKVRDVEEVIRHIPEEESGRNWALIQQGATIQVEGVHRRKDGTTFPVEVRVCKFGDDGQMLAVVRDVSARRVAEDSSAAKSQFLANMSHELRTPLNAIIGYSEMLADDAEDSAASELVPDLRKIESSGRHLLQLIGNMLDLSKIEAGNMDIDIEDVVLADLLASVTAELSSEATARGNGIRIASGAPIIVATDAGKLRQIVLNLLNNANKFTSQGSIEVSVDEIQRERPMVRIRVKDDGIGMNEDQVHHLFQAFTQADESSTREYGGTGLGLSLGRRLAELLGGDIFVSSEEGVGSTFTLELPLKQPGSDA
jgi:PAS domain S-box-containing protein